MNIIDIASEMQKICKDMDKIREVIVERSQQSALCESEYYKSKAVTIMRLKSGEEFEIDGVKISNPQATYMADLVKGLCYTQLLKKLESAGLLKSAYVQLSALDKKLSSYQSIFRHLDKV